MEWAWSHTTSSLAVDSGWFRDLKFGISLKHTRQPLPSSIRWRPEVCAARNARIKERCGENVRSKSSQVLHSTDHFQILNCAWNAYCKLAAADECFDIFDRGADEFLKQQPSKTCPDTAGAMTCAALAWSRTWNIMKLIATMEDVQEDWEATPPFRSLSEDVLKGATAFLR